MIFRDNRETAHAWASEGYEKGQNHNRKTFSFEGYNLYSYLECIARIYGNTVLVINFAYSVTTAKHINLAIDAMSHKRVIRVRTVSDPKDIRNVESLVEILLEQEKKHMRARLHAVNIVQAFDNLNDFLRIFELKLSPGQQERVNGVDWEKIEDKSRQIEATKERARQARRPGAAEYQEREEKMKKILCRWRDGENVKMPYNRDKVYLRIVGDEFETSLGARVPVHFAKYVWALASDLAIRGRVVPYHAKIGVFRISRIHEDGSLVVGCHTIPFSEIERMAKELGLTK